MPQLEDLLIATISSLSNTFKVEIHPGSANTPGTHLRISDYPSFELEGIRDACKTLGIMFKEMHKGNLSLLIIYDFSPLTIPRVLNDFQEQVRKSAALAKEDAAYLSFRNVIVEELSASFKTEINPGTANTPGKQLRIKSHLTDILAAIKQALRRWNIPVETKIKDGQHILVVRNLGEYASPEILDCFRAEMKMWATVPEDEIQSTPVVTTGALANNSFFARKDERIDSDSNGQSPRL